MRALVLTHVSEVLNWANPDVLLVQIIARAIVANRVQVQVQGTLEVVLGALILVPTVVLLAVKMAVKVCVLTIAQILVIHSAEMDVEVDVILVVQLIVKVVVNIHAPINAQKLVQTIVGIRVKTIAKVTILGINHKIVLLNE